jgi:hypothetical protein
MARCLRVERFVEHDVGLPKAGVEISVRPLNARFPGRQGAVGCARKILRRPLFLSFILKRAHTL